MALTKADRDAVSPSARAALYGAHHAACLRESMSPPVSSLLGFSQFAPEPLVASLRTAAGPASRPADRDVLDASIAEVTRLRRPDRGLQFEPELRATLPHDYCEDLTKDRRSQDRYCTCVRHAHGHVPPQSKRRSACDEHVALSTDEEVASGRIPPVVAAPKVRLHRPSIRFDEDTWVSTATEHVVFTNVQAEDAEDVFLVADPRDWDVCAPATFVQTLPGRYARGRFGRFEPEWHEVWEQERGGELFEDVAWNFNSRVRGGAQNVLRFTDVVRRRRRLVAEGDRPSPESWKPATDAWTDLDGDEPVVDSRERDAKYEWRYGYKYDLHLCIGANLMGSFQPGGLDIDEGAFSATWNEATRELEVTATKRLHYCEQPMTIQGFDLAMNLMAPALTAMFMRQMAVRGVAGAIDGTIVPRKKRTEAQGR